MQGLQIYDPIVSQGPHSSLLHGLVDWRSTWLQKLYEFLHIFQGPLFRRALSRTQMPMQKEGCEECLTLAELSCVQRSTQAEEAAQGSGVLPTASRAILTGMQVARLNNCRRNFQVNAHKTNGCTMDSSADEQTKPTRLHLWVLQGESRSLECLRTRFC